MSQDIIDLSRDYSLGGMNRRGFLDRLAQLAGGAAAALALLPVLEGHQEYKPLVPADDKSLTTETVQYDGGDAKISAYLARQKGASKRPAVIVIHENRGLTPHIEDVARRLAREGFLALAPDMLSPLGGTPKDQDKAPKMIGSLEQDKTVARLAAAVKFLASHPESNGKVGVTGFCWGGAMVNRVMASGADLKAGVAYYGSVLPDAGVPKISGPLMLHYAGTDARINAGIPGFEAALKANKKTYEKFVYEGAQHAFNNDSNPARYNKEAAELAWGRTVAFFKKYLA